MTHNRKQDMFDKERRKREISRDDLDYNIKWRQFMSWWGNNQWEQYNIYFKMLVYHN